MDINQTISTNKAISSVFVRKQNHKSDDGVSTNTKRSASSKHKISNEISANDIDTLDLNNSSKKIALENLYSQQSLSGINDAQELLNSFSSNFSTQNQIDNVIQLNANRVTSLIQ